MNRWLSSAAVTLTAIAVVGVAQPAAAAPPDEVSGSFEVPGICPFTVLLEVEGKAKTIERPDGSFILTSPGFVATATNTSTEAFVTWSITGSFHQSTLPNGDTFTKMTGRNLVTDPVAGFALISGDFSFTAAPDGSIVVPLNGKGRIVDHLGRLAAAGTVAREPGLHTETLDVSRLPAGAYRVVVDHDGARQSLPLVVR